MTKNPVWRFFASVKLALTILLILAVSSIIGTVVKQGQPSSYYVQEYGAKLARTFEAMNVTDMYSSWWFVALLSIFAINLVVCSIERLPRVWRLVTMDNLDIDSRQLEKMRFTHREETDLVPGAAADRIHQALARAGWKSQRAERDGSTLFFAQKGAWTRLGVYVVHLSILVILLGVLIGTLFGYQAYVFLPEGRATSQIFLRKTQEPIPLGFELQGDRFDKKFYLDGSVREYRADLTVSDPKRSDPYQKSVIVNDPLSYRGLTFYLGDSFPLEEYFVVVRNNATGAEEAFRAPSGRDVSSRATGVSFRIDDLRRDQEGVVHQAKIRVAAPGAAEPFDMWLNDKGSAVIGGPGENATIFFRQLYSTLFLVKKDPGVWVLFVGCGLMVVGLGISLFLSHRRIWVQISPRGKQGARILVAGTANKSQPAFERRFGELITRFDGDAPDNPVGEGCPIIPAEGR